MRKMLCLLLALALLLPLPAGRAAAYWDADPGIVCAENRTSCRLLSLVMRGAFDAFDPDDALSGRVLSAVYPQLCALEEEDFSHFAAEFQTEGEELQYCYHIALANCLWADILCEPVSGSAAASARLVLLLFLDPDSQPNAEKQMDQIRAELSDETLELLAELVDAPTAFVRWLIEEPDWSEHRQAAEST